MKFKWGESQGYVARSPDYINCEPFTLRTALAPFEIDVRKKTKFVTTETQAEWVESMCLSREDKSFGWQALVCSPSTEQCRLFAWGIADYLTKKADIRASWWRVDGRRYIEQPSRSHVYIVDSFLTFPNSATSVTFDPVRAGTVFDFASKHRGKSSVIILAPGLTVKEACFYSRLQPDFMIQLAMNQIRDQEEL